MIYMTDVILKNFQSHAYSHFQFDKGFNVILGPSDSGKTSVIRAIKWVLYNEPLGDYFIRQGEDECQVTIKFSHGIDVIRRRTKSKNSYILIDAAGNEEIFEGFGTNVPYEIEEAIGIRKVKLDRNESRILNIAEQLEGPFLLNEKGSTRANAIGTIVGVEKIDYALRETLRENKNIQSSLKKDKEQLETLTDKLKTYDYLDKLSKDINDAKACLQKVRALDEEIKKLDEISKLYLTIDERIQDINVKLKKLVNLETTEHLYFNITNLLLKFNQINIYYQKLQSIEKNLGNSNDTLNKLSELNILIDYSQYLDKLNVNLNNLINYSATWTSLNLSIKKTKNRVINLETLKTEDKYLSKIEDILPKLRIVEERHRQYKKLNQRITNGYEYINRFLHLNEAENETHNVATMVSSLDKLKKYYTDWVKINVEIETLSHKINTNEKLIIKIKENTKNLLQQINQCPLCGQSLDDSHIESIINNGMVE